EIQGICKDNNLILIEDAAHAHGSEINRKKAGTLGLAGAFSFYPTKVMTTCTGGMITTQNDDLANYAISLRHHGVGSSLHDVTNLGNDWLMNEVQALLGIYQLRALENNIERRNYIADKYLVGLNKIDGIKLFQIPQNTRCSYYKYPIFLAQDIDKSRLVEEMKNKYHIRLGSVYDPPCHLQPVYKKLFGYEEGMLPESERTLKKTVCLPIFVQMTDDQIDYVLQSLKKSILQCRNTDVV
ncbi:MAG: DegT/DnrJ/EryC1/StrS family aminotransferase, partial [Candidatus Aenigmarchaeota archaeon]|nr:DegT/DnrJ/EryC1/StrS family aminotransferase [Candidatus Aenigmarchaeota archaeon]